METSSTPLTAPRLPARLRVLIVEDSRLQARLLQHALQVNDDIEVVGIAPDGREALCLVDELQPDLITMDVRLPHMDGLEVTRTIMATRPTPILVVAELPSRHDTVAQKMLGAGALDIFLKPHGDTQWAAAGERLGQRIRVLSRVQVVTHTLEKLAPPSRPSTAVTAPPAYSHTAPHPHLVAMVASTGGPNALLQILSALPGGYPIPLVIVQHIATGFGVGLAEWLGRNCRIPVHLVTHAMRLTAPGVYIAPDDRHLALASAHELTLSTADPIGSEDPPRSYRPRGDVLLRSVARVWGARALGIILTGMGDDGVLGLDEMRRSGALTIAQDESSSAIYGMPKVAAERGAAAQVLSLQAIIALLASLGVP